MITSGSWRLTTLKTYKHHWSFILGYLLIWFYVYWTAVWWTLWGAEEELTPDQNHTRRQTRWHHLSGTFTFCSFCPEQREHTPSVSTNRCTLHHVQQHNGTTWVEADWDSVALYKLLQSARCGRQKTCPAPPTVTADRVTEGGRGVNLTQWTHATDCPTCSSSSIITSSAHLWWFLHLVTDVNLPELFKEAEHGQLQPLVARLSEPRVSQIHQLEHPKVDTQTQTA